MEAYEAEEERKRTAAEQNAADDGWTVVTRKAGRKRKQGVAPAQMKFNRYQHVM